MNSVDSHNTTTEKAQKSHVLYCDVDSLPHEGFTSGLLITVREMIRRLQSDGFNARIGSIAQSKKKEGIVHRTEQGISLTEHFVNSLNNNAEVIRNAVCQLINEAIPDVVLMNTPAVFFHEAHHVVLEEAIKSGAKVVVMVVDELFPTTPNFPEDRTNKYYQLLHSNNVQILTISDTIRRKFFQVSGLESDYLPQLFDVENILTPSRESRYITLINTHPIKGISVFSEIAKLLSDKEFMVVENWTDVPSYAPETGNVTVSPLFSSVRDLYKKARIILVPSLCNEGASRVVIEAMLNGIPVIAHHIGSLPEIGKNRIHFVNPPAIKGYRFEGTIMYPVIDKDEVMSVAHDFADRITKIDEDYDIYSDSSKEAGLSYCRRNEALFSKLTKSWFSG